MRNVADAAYKQIVFMCNLIKSVVMPVIKLIVVTKSRVKIAKLPKMERVIS